MADKQQKITPSGPMGSDPDTKPKVFDAQGVAWKAVHL